MHRNFLTFKSFPCIYACSLTGQSNETNETNQARHAIYLGYHHPDWVRLQNRSIGPNKSYLSAFQN